MEEIDFGFRVGGRDPRRIQVVLDVLKEVWEKHPDLRLGQILVNAAGEHARQGDVFYVEDDVMVEGLRRLLNGRGGDAVVGAVELDQTVLRLLARTGGPGALGEGEGAMPMTDDELKDIGRLVERMESSGEAG